MSLHQTIIPSASMTVKLEGPLTKWTNVVQGWQYRWFVLDENTGLLSYYTSKDKMMRGARRGCLRLKDAKIGINNEDDSTFTITCDHRTFHFQARDSDERIRWVECLEETISKHSQSNIGPSAYALATEEELNKRMQEAEVYFRLLTQQAKNLELKINRSNKPVSDRSSILKDSLTQMIETIGQTIELLHTTKQSLAKKVPVPVIPNKLNVKQAAENGNHTPVTTTPSIDIKDIESEIDNISLRSGDSKDDTMTVDIVNENVEITSSGISESINDSSAPTSKSSSPVLPNKILLDMNEIKEPDASIHLISIANASVPINSYTSSDEEDVDEFFDAADEFDVNEIKVDNLENSIKEENDKINGIEENVFENGSTNDDTPLINVDQIIAVEEKLQEAQPSKTVEVESMRNDQYDVEDDPFGETNADDMQQHGSVITHLLSQVRIGMDLTKVTLPTFILERRSLLEMYADFFAHPDLFKSIPDYDDPADRMIQVLKWYLSSFHAGRKGDIAKKPYNPILGEIFQCFYDMSDKSDRNDKVNGQNNYGTEPIPWASKSDVSFLAEQVSHHPPISAFYAECEEKNLCFNSHIWTKSKFLGLSIGVHNVGTGNVYLGDQDEEYAMSFPSGYCRSILTMPWIELGGKTEITCASTGFSAQIEFHTKPFYGGKKNRVTAEVYGPVSRKPYLSVFGEWNGVIYCKKPDAKEQEVFFDTLTVPTQRKYVRALGKQEEFESRRMWQIVTTNLKENNIEGATAGKHRLEEVQRQDARMRKETNTKWVTRFFDEWEEGEESKFHYKRPLYTRKGMPKPDGRLSLFEQ